MKNFRNVQNNLFFITILFFFVSMINITFAILAVVCFILPFYYYLKYKKKIWCQYICPRAGMFNVLLSKISLNLKAPKILSGKFIKEFFTNYFFVSLTVVIFSTFMVYIGKIMPMTQVRFFLFFVVPFDLPQLININAAPALIHFGYRVYSMLFTTVIIGMILGFLYKPRTWCSICPISTLTTKKVILKTNLFEKKPID
jgi:hypothetical protein